MHHTMSWAGWRPIPAVARDCREWLYDAQAGSGRGILEASLSSGTDFLILWGPFPWIAGQTVPPDLVAGRFRTGFITGNSS